MVHDRVGSYRIVRLLGEGGMGLVYEAIRDDIGGRAAIKILRAEFSRSPDITSRFLNEARAVNIVQHPGVVRIFDFGQLPSGEPYLTMEFLDGQTLRDRLTSEGRLHEMGRSCQSRGLVVGYVQRRLDSVGVATQLEHIRWQTASPLHPHAE